MKKLLLALVTVLALTVAGAEPFEWSFERVDGAVEVIAVVAPAHYLYAEHTTVTGKSADKVEVASIASPESRMIVDDFTGEDMPVFGAGRHVWRFPPEVFLADIAYMGCRVESEAGPPMCFMPQEITLGGELSEAPPAEAETAAILPQFRVERTLIGLANAEEMIAFLQGEEQADPLAGRNFWLLLILIFLGGAALNLTPCILPLIPVNLAIISGGGRKLPAAICYSAGMAGMFGGLGVIAVSVGGVFGGLNHLWWFNLGVGVMMLALSLSMFGVFNIDLTRYRSFRIDQWKRGRLVGVFFMGVIAALLAGACVAPVITSVLIIAATGAAAGEPFAILWPFWLGVGMAAPWIVAAAGLTALPKPGAWMRYVKWGFGVAILLLGVYYLVIGYRQLPVASTARDYCMDSEIARLEEALSTARDTGKPVFVELWSTTCKNCLYMERTTFADARVRAALEDFIKVKIQLEDFRHPAARELMSKFSSPGLPTVAIIHPEGK